MVGPYLVSLQNYKNIIKEISLEAEKNKKEIHFYYSSSNNFENQKFLILTEKLLSFWIIIHLFQNSLIEKFLHKTLHSITISKSKVFFIFSQLDSVSLESQMKNLNSINNNNPNIHFIDPIKKKFLL